MFSETYWMRVGIALLFTIFTKIFKMIKALKN